MAARDKPLTVKFVATEGLVWQGEVVSVLVRTTEGDIGIWSGHEPFMAALVPHGAEIVTDVGARHIIAVDSGFISPRPTIRKCAPIADSWRRSVPERSRPS